MVMSEEDSQILARWKESSANMSPNIPIGVQVIKRGLIKDPVDRHYLLQEMVAATYRLRKTHEQYRKLCGQIAELHLREFPSMVEPLKAWMGEETKRAGGKIPIQVTTFTNYATLLTEAGEFEKAIAVCETAIRLGCIDWHTAMGYEGRIERIRKKAKGRPTT